LVHPEEDEETRAEHVKDATEGYRYGWEGGREGGREGGGKEEMG